MMAAIWGGSVVALFATAITRWAVHRALVRGYLEGRSASITFAESEYRRGFEAGRQAASRLWRVPS